MLINHKPWLTCCWLTGQCYYTETLLTRFLQAYCSQSPTSFFIFFTGFWWTVFKILMSSNHSYIHSLSYREAQGFKMSEGTDYENLSSGRREHQQVRLAVSRQPCIRPYMVTVVSGEPEAAGLWEVRKRREWSQLLHDANKSVGRHKRLTVTAEPRTKYEHFFRDPWRLFCRKAWCRLRNCHAVLQK